MWVLELDGDFGFVFVIRVIAQFGLSFYVVIGFSGVEDRLVWGVGWLAKGWVFGFFFCYIGFGEVLVQRVYIFFFCIKDYIIYIFGE